MEEELRLFAVIAFIFLVVFFTTIYSGQHLVAAWAMTLTLGVVWLCTSMFALIPAYFNHKYRIFEQALLVESSKEHSPPQIQAKFDPKAPWYTSARIATSVISMITLWYVLVTILPTPLGGQVDKIEIIHAGRSLTLIALLIFLSAFVLTLIALPVTFRMNMRQSRIIFRTITKAVNFGFGLSSLGSAIVWYTMCARVVGAAQYNHRFVRYDVYRSLDAVWAVIVLSFISLFIWDFCFKGEVLQLKTLKTKYLSILAERISADDLS